MSSAPAHDELAPNTDWRKYVLAPANPDARPVGVLRTAGDVTGLGELLTGTGELVLAYDGNGTCPEVVLDYGTNVAGRPWIVVSDADGRSSLQISFSESAHWAGRGGDERGGHNASADRSREHTIEIAGPARIDSPEIQGGQRYQRISLESAGVVRISAVGFACTFFRATPKDYRGWFSCSSDELTRIWYESAYTVQLNQLPADTLPVPWSIDGEGLRVKGGTLGVLREGADWTDLTVAFETKVLDNAAGWVVRAEGGGNRGYLLELRSSEDSSGVLRWSFFDDGHEARPQDTVRRYTVLGEVPLPSGLDLAVWHSVRTTVEASSIAVTIDDADIAHIALRDHPGTDLVEKGSIGFHEAWYTSKVPGEQARFRNLRVTTIDGELLFDHPLDQESVLDRFVGDGLVSPDPLPVILDGARRDRSVWSGDLIVQVPNVFYTTGAADYVSGSIEFLNSWQEADGRLPARMPPLFPPATPPQHGQVYSAVYSMHQITNVALHHLYTGDVGFVREQWPAILRQLEYDAHFVDDRGLYLTDDEGGLDWDWYDGPKTGAVTAYNVTYQHVLRQSSDLAAAIGEPQAAAELLRQADRTRAAINAHLFDPERQLYVLSESRPEAIAQDANSLAVLHNVAPRSEAPAVLQALDAALPQTPFGPQPFSAATGFQENVSPYASGFHLNALFEAGLTEDAFKLIHNLWGHMAAPGPYAAGTVWELMNVDGTPGFGSTTSLAHGWACAPTVALSSYVLGITPTSAAFHTWSIAPQTGPLTWARGQVPTPFGPIEASWTSDGPSFTLEIQVPEGTSGTVTVPASPGSKAALSGPEGNGEDHTLILTAETGAPTISFDITAPGRYTVETTR
jgi:alpha-L-rhamnosidase